MSEETIARLCKEALARVDYYIARMAAQQKRRYIELWRK